MQLSILNLRPYEHWIPFGFLPPKSARHDIAYQTRVVSSINCKLQRLFELHVQVTVDAIGQVYEEQKLKVLMKPFVKASRHISIGEEWLLPAG
jgi:hypothetical protein